MKHSVPANHFMAKMSIRRFAEFVGMEMVSNGLTKDNFGGKKTTQKPLDLSFLPSRVSSSTANASVGTITRMPTDSHGFVTMFPPTPASALVGSFIDGNKVEQVIGKHVIVRRKTAGRCHICTAVHGPSTNSRSKLFCTTCERPVCPNQRARDDDFCMDIHALCRSDALKGKRGSGVKEVARAITEHRGRQAMKTQIEPTIDDCDLDSEGNRLCATV